MRMRRDRYGIWRGCGKSGKKVGEGGGMEERERKDAALSSTLCRSHLFFMAHNNSLAML